MATRNSIPAVVALDVGGTTIKSLTVTRDQVLAVATCATLAQQGPAAVLETVLREAERAVESVDPRHRVVGIGFASPGTVDETAGLCRSSENLGWRDVPLRELIRARTGLPVGFGHDVRAGGLAELHMGAGLGAASVAYLSLGTGISCAIMIDGSPLIAAGYAGEVGHGGEVTGEPCVCGGRGCPETYASAAAIARRYTRITGRAVDGAEEVLARVRCHDTDAQLVWDEALDGLAKLTSEIVRVTGITHIVVGGGLARAGETLLSPLAERTTARLTIHPSAELVPAALTGVSGSWGAALLGWQAAGYSLEEVASGYRELGQRVSLTEAAS